MDKGRLFRQNRIKEMQIKENVFFGFIYTANRFPRLYKRRVQKPLALKNFVFGNSRMYDMLDRVGNLQEKVK